MPGVTTLMAMTNPGWGRGGRRFRLNTAPRWVGSYQPKGPRFVPKRKRPSLAAHRRPRDAKTGHFLSAAAIAARRRAKAAARARLKPKARRRATHRKNSPTRSKKTMARAARRRSPRRRVARKRPVRRTRTVRRRASTSRPRNAKGRFVSRSRANPVRRRRRNALTASQRKRTSGWRNYVSRAYKRRAKGKGRTELSRILSAFGRMGAAKRRGRKVRIPRANRYRRARRNRYIATPEATVVRANRGRRRRRRVARANSPYRRRRVARRRRARRYALPVTPRRNRRRRARRANPIHRRRRYGRRTYRANPRHRRYARRNRRYGRRYGHRRARRNFALTMPMGVGAGLAGAVKSGVALVAAFAAGNAFTALTDMLLDRTGLKARIPVTVAPFMPVVTSGLALVAGHFATQKVAPLRKYRSLIMLGLGFHFASKVAGAIVARLPAGAVSDNIQRWTGIAPVAGLGNVTYGYIDNPYRYMSGMGLLQAPAGMGAYVHTPHATQVQGLGEYTRVPVGLLEAPAGVGQMWARGENEEFAHFQNEPGLTEAGAMQLAHAPTGVFGDSVFGFPPGIQAPASA